MVNQIKLQQVNNIVERLQDKDSFLLVKFEKTNHKTFESIRRDLKKTKAYLEIVKNSLFRKAINKLSIKNKAYRDLRKRFFPLTQNTAMISFEGDWGKGMKTFFQFMQKEKTLDFKCALIENQPYGAVELMKIAKLPSKEELVAQFIGTLKSPSSHLVYSLKFNMNRFVYVINQRR